MTTIDDIFDSFEFLDGWEERYGFIIDLGRKLPEMDPALKNEGSKVVGCMSQVWLVGQRSDDTPARLSFLADSDSTIVKGLIAVLKAIFDHKTAAEVLATDVEELFGRLGLAQHISVNRRNGFFAMVERIRQTARNQSA